ERGRKGLADRLGSAQTTDAAWPLARVLARLVQANPEAWADELFPKATAYLEAGDRRADALLFVLREGSAAGVRDRLEKRAEELYYLGFHFVEQGEEPLRAFGGAVLQLLLKRFGRNKLAAAATAKLESAGLVEKKGKRK